jgi:putative ABC transport system permease protein
MTIRGLAGIPAVVSPFWVVMGVGISVGVGLFFGYYPANRAANLDPIVCLRYE